MDIEKILPKYSWIPIALFFVVNCTTYYGTRLLAEGHNHHNISTGIDGRIPFLSWMIVIYLLAFLQWTVGFYVIARENKRVCYILFTGEIIAKLICFIFYVFFPTTMYRPVIENNNFFDFITLLIYRIDSPDNLFPSIHCLESYICLRSTFYIKKMPKIYKALMIIMTLLVFASTVTVKQHVVADICGAIIVGEFGIFVSKKFIWKKLG